MDSFITKVPHIRGAEIFKETQYNLSSSAWLQQFLFFGAVRKTIDCMNKEVCT